MKSLVFIFRKLHKCILCRYLYSLSTPHCVNYSAHWCPPCKQFTPILASLYKKLKESGKKFEIVFASSDHSEEEFKEYFGSMPWLALPLNHESIHALNKQYKVNGIPTLVLLDSNGVLFNAEGRDAIAKDTTGARFPWKPPTFFESLGTTFTFKDGSVPFENIKGKTLGLYFSAHWCGPCRGFTPKLIETYKKMKAKRDDFEIIFCSSDKSDEEFKEYYGGMPWLALPFSEREKKEQLSDLFQVRGIPSFIVVGPDGKVITKDGRGAVDADPEGLEFPWLPKAVHDLNVSADGLNDSACVIMMLEKVDDAVRAENIAAIQPVAEEVQAEARKNGTDSDIRFFFATKKSGVVDQVRALTKSAPFTLVIVNIPDDGGYYVCEDTKHTSTSVRQFVHNFQQGKLTRRQMEG